MGCVVPKAQEKSTDSKTPKTSSAGQPFSQAVNASSVFEDTENIETDYILHKLDPLTKVIQRRGFPSKIVPLELQEPTIAKILGVNYFRNLRRMQILYCNWYWLCLKLQKHLNIQGTMSYYCNKKRLSLIGEYLEGGNLLLKLDVFSQMQQFAMIEIFCQIMAGLQYLHENQIAHGDIRLEHIIFTNKSLDKIKLVDFGISNQMKSLSTNWKAVSSMHELSFRSPEALKGQITMKSDIWSCGCLLYFFLTSHMPFQANSIQSLRNSILRGVPNFEGSEWNNIDPALKYLISKMLHPNPSQRPSARQVLNHNVFVGRARILQNPNKTLQRHMRDFKISSQLQTAMLIYIADNLMSDQDKKKLMDEFMKFDLNNDGQLSKEELLSVYSRTLSHDRALKEVNNIFKKIDVNGSGKIDYQAEFVIATIDQKKYFNKEKLMLIFQQIDSDHSGQLNKEELKKLLRDMSIPIKKYEQLSRQLDSNGDGQINQEEFIGMMLQI
ncbi:unnamed protein product (macronuclear) [Paramecium tetraurelia]|uniref:Protein kinase domain containing protein n=1 Tax=Paramecium tetraurelia TaxID=5888 RepID=A0CM45_PARTE|nr:uncharacterized protein GSPATT00008341001 [Paramecium tetraurelia]CAK71862.1 unnamed protein product [Paramecium tetraurelia]|eukprot:XP_001439259.1 hypothetical protein (macronuclear) [Paramecium tetraurelia strain d4-2]